MYRVCKKIILESGHFHSSKNCNNKCASLHGHSRTVELIFASDSLDENDMVCNFQMVKVAFGEFFDSLDHVMMMNAKSEHCEYFKKHFDRIICFDGDPTTEAIAEKIFKHITTTLNAKREFIDSNGLKFHIRNNVYLERVRVWETSSSWAEYSIS